jgi:hypothetical protein
MRTKQQLIEDAYGEMGLASYTFDLEPEEMQTALRRMDAMWATWEAAGIRQGYNFPGGLSDDSGLPDVANEPTFCELAIRLAPGKGKQINPDTKRNARDGLAALYAIAAMPMEQQRPSTMPRGAGNKTWRGPCGTFYPTPTFDPLVADSSDDLIITP